MSSGRPLKVLLIINALRRYGGAEIQLRHLAGGLARLGHEVTVCSLETTRLDRDVLGEEGIKLISFGVEDRFDRGITLPRLIRLARRADVVHCTMWDASLWGRLAAIAARRPVVVADHSADRVSQVSAKGAPRASWIARHNRLLDRFTYATVACATSQRPLLVSEGVDPGKIVYIPNGIPLEEITEAAKSGPGRRDLDIPEGAPVAMQVAVFRPEKNQIGAVEAFKRVRETVADAQLVFVGGGPTRAEVEGRAGEAGDGIHFLGPRGDVPGLLALADLKLVPSTSDAMPMTVLEAMALGVPVVASDLGDTRAALGDEAGISVPAGDTAALADAWIRVLTDGELRARLGRAGAQRARQFDASLMVRRYAALLDAASRGDPVKTAVSAVKGATTEATGAAPAPHPEPLEE